MNRTMEHGEARTVSVEAAARTLGIGRSLAYELVRTGQLPSLRLGRRIVVPKVAIESLLESAVAGDTQPQHNGADAA